MKRVLLIFAVIVTALISSPAVSMAAAPFQLEGKIKLVGYMPAAHYIYIDRDEHVTKVVSNTSDKAQPFVIDWQNKDGIMNDDIWQQYQQILDQNHHHLLAGHTYELQKQQTGLVKNLGVISWLRFKLATY